jgi:hypothetical protein
MIVNYKEEGWEVITQRAHGLLAAQIGFHWQLKERPQRWLETLLAVAEHDDAENELDGETLITEAGGPLNYAMKKFDLAHCRKLAALTITKSRYIALLTSMHMEFLYGRGSEITAEAKAFLSEQSKLRIAWQEELKISKEESLRIYAFLEWCDAMSLLICKGELQPEGRAIEISSGPGDVRYYLKQAKDETLSVEPWPFELPSFQVSYDSRTVSSLHFASSAAFRKEFLAAPVTGKSFVFKKQMVAKAKRKANDKFNK